MKAAAAHKGRVDSGAEPVPRLGAPAHGTAHSHPPAIRAKVGFGHKGGGNGPCGGDHPARYFRHAPGLRPTRRVKVRVKWAWSAKPQASATIESEASRLRSIALAVSPGVGSSHPGGAT